MPKIKLEILDEVNVKFHDLPVECRRELVKELEYFVPGARYLPSVRLGRWSGKASFCSIGGSTYLNLLDKLLPIVQKHGFEIEIDDKRAPAIDFRFDKVDEDSYKHVIWPKGHPAEGQSVKLRDHQIESINSYLENITGVSVIPTGAGKTILTSVLSHKVQPYGRSIIIVPSKDLVTQTEQDYKNFGLDTGVFYGDRKEYGKTHTICTWQSLESLSKKSKDQELDVDIDKFFEGVVCVIADETHRVKGEVLKKLLSTHLANVPIRWGLTGTMPEEESDRMSILACIGPMIGQIKTKELQEKGILSNLHINVWQLQDVCELFGNYQAELKWLTTNKKRVEFLAAKMAEISNTGNTLILVDRIQTGEMLQLLIPGSVFVSGKMKSSDRKKEYNEIQEVDGKVIIASFGVASTGINIPRIFNLILFEPGKSFVKVIQSIGRGLRTAADKDYVNVYDVCSVSKYSKKHLAARKKFYKEAEYEYTIEKVKY